jgi:hypothetical protein
LEAGQDLGIRNAGYRAINSLHFEKGYCYWGAELTPEYTPYDAGLGFCVDLCKGDFLGRRALSKAKEKGKFSISPACIRKIPLNPPLQKGKEVGMPGLIENLQKKGRNGSFALSRLTPTDP